MLHLPGQKHTRTLPYHCFIWLARHILYKKSYTSMLHLPDQKHTINTTVAMPNQTHTRKLIHQWYTCLARNIHGNSSTNDSLAWPETYNNNTYQWFTYLVRNERELYFTSTLRKQNSRLCLLNFAKNLQYLLFLNRGVQPAVRIIYFSQVSSMNIFLDILFYKTDDASGGFKDLQNNEV